MKNWQLKNIIGLSKNKLDLFLHILLFVSFKYHSLWYFMFYWYYWWKMMYYSNLVLAEYMKITDGFIYLFIYLAVLRIFLISQVLLNSFIASNIFKLIKFDFPDQTIIQLAKPWKMAGLISTTITLRKQKQGFSELPEGSLYNTSICTWMADFPLLLIF
jgi:hypothetical protein